MTLHAPLPRRSGIYGIVSPSGNMYVGSSKDIRTRVAHHRNLLRQGKHHSSTLQAAYAKYGEALSAFVLEECPVDALIPAEQRHIDTLKPKYNQSPIAGRIEHTDEMRRKKSESLRGKPKSAEHRANLAASRLGHKTDMAVRERMSETRKGRKHSEETKAKIGAKHKGKYVSPETRAKLSNKVITPEMRARMRDAALRRHRPDQDLSP